MRLPRINDPGRVILRRAGRAALLVPSTFAVVSAATDEVQAALFAAFGTFALIAFADFSGPPIPRSSAYLVTALFGAPLIAIGTALSGSLIGAAVATLVLVFAIRLAGALGGYPEAAGVTLILTFVLAVAIEVPFEELGWRLVGWCAATAAATISAFVLWPHRERSRLQKRAAGACRDLASAIRAGSSAGELESLSELEHDYATMPYRPAGPWERYRALRRLVDLLLRVRGYLPMAPTAGSAEENLRAQSGDLLDATADRLEGAADVPDLIGLEAARSDARESGVEAVGVELGSGTSTEEVLERIDARVRLRLISYTALSVAANAILMTGRKTPPAHLFDIPPEVPEPAGAGGALWGVVALLRAQLTLGSVRLHDAARVGAGLTVAVLVAQIADVSHAFWVVLATLLVLRTDALGTGRTALEAILGTTAGFVIASLMVIAIGDNTALLWIAMPIAAFLAAYTPGAVHFVVGQGAFTLFVVVLFNLVEPEGWRVALVRLEDVAIGAGVSLVIGLVLWPRGAGVVLRQNLAESIRLGSRYVAETFAVVLGNRAPDDPLTAEREAVVSATNRSSEALSQHLGEPGVHLADHTWDSLLAMPRQLRGAGDLLLGIARFYGTGGAGPALAQQGAEVTGRYVELASALVGGAPGRDGDCQASATEADRADGSEAAIPSGSAPGHPLEGDPARAEVIAALRAAVDDERARNEAARLVLAHEWMVLLAEIAESSAEPVAEAAAASARAWWR